MKLSGAVVAYWAHNPEVCGSNPGHAMLFRMDLQKIDAFRDHLLSIKEKLSSNRNNLVYYFSRLCLHFSSNSIST